MASVDFNRDDLLNEEEYVRFLNKLTTNEFTGLNFKDLGSPLPENFSSLAKMNGQINIFGSKPGQTVPEEQQDFLEQLCVDTAVALSRVGETFSPTSTPTVQSTTKAPTVSRPALPAGIAEVFNSFIISNNAGKTAEQLDSNDLEGLDNAYETFAMQSVKKLVEDQRILQELENPSSLRRRRLVSTIVADSDEIYLLLDNECPDAAVDGSICQVAFAKFRVNLDDDEDAQAISVLFTAETQKFIEAGALQTALLERDDRTLLTIVEESFPVSSTFAPSEAPLEGATLSPAPEVASGDEDEGGGGVVGIVLGIIGAIVVIGLLAYAYKKGYISMPSGAGSLNSGGKKKKKMKKQKTEDDDDDDEFGAGEKDDDDGSEDKERGNTFGLDAKKENGFGDDDADPFGAKEQATDDKKGFGFGRKKGDKKESKADDDNAFGEPGKADTFGENDGSVFGDYAFDEPSITQDRQEAQEKGSPGGNENNMFEAPESPVGEGAGFGGDFFGGSQPGWGATEPASGEGDNFFSAAGGFGEDDAKSQGSQSGSGSYTSSDDSTYESNAEGEGNEEADEEGEGSESDDGTKNSTMESESSRTMPADLVRKSEEMDAMIEAGNWDGIANAATDFEGESLNDSKVGGEGSLRAESIEEGDEDDDDSFSGSGSQSGSDDDETETSLHTDAREKRAEYQAQVEALVRLVVPDELGKVDAMMEQFKGREPELVSTLQTMQERSATQRARAAVHKSKTKPTRGDGSRPDGFSMHSGLAGGTEGSAAGTAAIAAASLPIPADGFEGAEEYADDLPPDDNMGFGGDAFADEVDPEGSYTDGSRSYYSDEDGSRSGSRSYYSDEEGGSQGSRSYYSDEEGGSQEGGSQEGGSQVGGSQVGGSLLGSQAGSQDGSDYSDEEEGRSLEGSRSKGSRGSQGSGSFDDDEGSGSYTDEGAEDDGWK
jgi:hypothetical protein